MEAAAAIRGDTAPSGDLELPGGEAFPPPLPTTRIEVRKPPDLSNVPARDIARVIFVASGVGDGGFLEITDDIQPETREAIVLTAPPSKRGELEAQIERHLDLTAAAKAPSERGEIFHVPRLCALEQGELELIDRGMVTADFRWDLLATPPDLSSFRFNDDSMTFEVDLDGHGVSYHAVKDDVATYLPGFAQDRSDGDLIGWLDQEIRDPSIKQPVLREWLRRAVRELIEGRGFSLAQLLKGQFILRRKLQEELIRAKDLAYRKGFQHALFGGALEIVADEGPGYGFAYPADMARYPAHWYYRGIYRFRKHYYPVPGDLKNVGEEFECARQIDLLDEVQFWVRNLVHPTQFWMPTSTMRTYPDFVAKLKDGRLLVVEYKGGDRFTADQEEEKRMIGELWARRSNGKGLYHMARLADERGHNVRDQLLAVIGT
jgi:type III restriction enzyme